MERPEPGTASQAVIAKGVKVQGEISGADSLFVDGTVEGIIHLPGQRVTVGRNGHVIAPKSPASPCILASEIVILGTVTGNVEAADRVDLRAQASLAGNVSTARVAIEDGAYFKGGIDIRRGERPGETPAALKRGDATGKATPEPSAPETVQV